MKNLALGLLLTVGTTTSMFAGDNMNKSTKIIKENKNALLSCLHGYKLVLVDCDGKKTSMNVGSMEGGCGDNEDGSIIFHVSYKNTCGPWKSFSEALDQIQDIL